MCTTHLSDDRAVTPAIGIVLVVAIAVILAAIVSMYGLGAAQQVQDAPPSVEFNLEYENIDDGTPDNDEIRITHGGGQSFEASHVKIVVGSTTVYDNGQLDSALSLTNDGTQWPDTVESTDTQVVKEDGDDIFESGGEVQIIWRAPNGETSEVIGESTVG